MLPPTRPTRELLEAALRARHLDRTLTTNLPSLDPRDESSTCPTGIPLLDVQLGGGFPRGQLSEVVGARSSGGTSVLLRLMATATARGELVALIDALDMLDVESAVASGVDLDRLLWVRGEVASSAGDRSDRAITQAIKALTLVLQAGNFGLVALDLGEAPVEVLHQLPSTTWLRLQRMIEGSQVVCLLTGNHQMARSAAGLTLQLGTGGSLSRTNREDQSGPSTRRPGFRFGVRMFEGIDVETRVIRARVRTHEGAVAMLSTTVSPQA